VRTIPSCEGYPQLSLNGSSSDELKHLLVEMRTQQIEHILLVLQHILAFKFVNLTKRQAACMTFVDDQVRELADEEMLQDVAVLFQ
jgi:hypothetical protein